MFSDVGNIIWAYGRSNIAPRKFYCSECVKNRLFSSCSKDEFKRVIHKLVLNCVSFIVIVYVLYFLTMDRMYIVHSRSTYSIIIII